MTRIFRNTTALSACAVLLTGCILVVPLSVVTNGAAALPAPGPAPASAGCATPAGRQAMADDLLSRVNAERRSAGHAPLRADPRLATVAQGHACDNAARQVFSHSGSDGSDLRTRLRRGGYGYRTAAENTGLGFDGAPARLVAFWMGSPYHRANMLDRSLTEAGVGMADGPRPAWVMVFGRPR